MSVLSKRREKRKKQDKWVLGEKLTKAGRARSRRRKTVKKITKVLKTGGKVTTQRPDMKSKAAYKMGAEHKKALGKKQKIRKGAKEVLITKGGAYAKYGKKSKAAGSFRSAFKSKCVEGAKSFSWDGRSYSCAKAGPAKKAAKPVAKPGALKSLAKRAPGAKKTKKELLIQKAKKLLTLTQKAERAGVVGVKRAPAPKGKKRTVYEMISGGKTAAQHREERKAKRRSGGK